MLFDIPILACPVLCIGCGWCPHPHTDRTVTFELKDSKLNMITRTNEHNITDTDTYKYT